MKKKLFLPILGFGFLVIVGAVVLHFFVQESSEQSPSNSTERELGESTENESGNFSPSPYQQELDNIHNQTDPELCKKALEEQALQQWCRETIITNNAIRNENISLCNSLNDSKNCRHKYYYNRTGEVPCSEGLSIYNMDQCS